MDATDHGRRLRLDEDAARNVIGVSPSVPTRLSASPQTRQDASGAPERDAVDCETLTRARANQRPNLGLRSVSFEIPGRPVPYTRMTQRSKYVVAAAQRYMVYRESVGWAARAAGVCEPFTGPVSLTVEVRIGGGTRGDLDNYVKGVCDGLNGIVWNDDKQVTRLHASMVLNGWSDEGISVTVEEVG